MAKEDFRRTEVYYATAVNRDGENMSTWNRDADGWMNGECVQQDSFLNRQELLEALSFAERAYTDVKVFKVYVGEEMQPYEISDLKSAEKAHQRRLKRQQLISEKNLTPEEVAILADRT